MPSPATTAPAQSSAPAATGLNPFWAASNWYSEPNNDEILNGSFQLTAAAKPFSISLNSNGYTKDARIAVRSSGAVGGIPTPDSPQNLFRNLTFKTPTGSEFFQDMTGWDHKAFQAWGRPWEGNPDLWWDYAKNINPSFTMKLAPELRYTAGCLPNMDDRRLYKVDGYVAPNSDITSGTITTSPTVTFATTITTWAQPDDNNLLEQPNQTVPPGIRLQTFRRKTSLTLNSQGNNTLDMRTLTGNLQRLIMLVFRDSNGARQDYFSDPIVSKLDNRTLANYTQANLFSQFQDFFGTGVWPRQQGCLVLPRYFNPGTLVGQGWLPTDGASKEIVTTTTLTGAANLPGTVDVLIEDLVPLAGLPLNLTNI